MASPTLVAVTLAGLIGLAGCTSTPAPAKAECGDNTGHPIHACDDFFAPKSFDAKAGQAVQWQNADKGHHTVTVQKQGSTTPGDTLQDSGDLAPGASFSFTFPSPGKYDVYCKYHSQGGQAVFTGGMVMKVTVSQAG